MFSSSCWKGFCVHRNQNLCKLSQDRPILLKYIIKSNYFTFCVMGKNNRFLRDVKLSKLQPAALYFAVFTLFQWWVICDFTTSTICAEKKSPNLQYRFQTAFKNASARILELTSTFVRWNSFFISWHFPQDRPSSSSFSVSTLEEHLTLPLAET